MPFFADYHMHSHHSFDAHFPVRDMAEAAVRAGLEEICFTNHIDFEDPEYADRPADLAAQKQEIDAAAAALPITILHGAEIGLSPDQAISDTSYNYIKDAGLDFIIGSVHMVAGQNTYVPPYFEHRSREEAYTAYVAEIGRAIRTLPCACTLGHYDFVTKRAPYENRPLRYQDAPDAFDSLLRYLAQNGKAMEINTSAWWDEPAWGLDVLRRFRELGGEYVTFGSDAHKPENVGRRLEEARALAKEAGIRYTARFRQLKPEFILL
ncbi:MAG: histidinol-phosphatase HisJ family protein [Clostridia bacterium]|nr:histidinol-phosphatase HisJ family protein [Clostridia bacterium]